MTDPNTRGDAGIQPASQTGECQVCGRVMRLKNDGTLRHHGGSKQGQWPYTRAYRCKGSGLEPKS